MNMPNLTDLQINQIEYCYMTSSQHYSSTSIQVRVPKLMPMLLPSSTKVFNKNILINDNSCRPHVRNSIKTQSYITVKRSPNCSLAHKADINGIVAAGTNVSCTCMNGNIKDMIVTDSLYMDMVNTIASGDGSSSSDSTPPESESPPSEDLGEYSVIDAGNISEY